MCVLETASARKIDGKCPVIYLPTSNAVACLESAALIFAGRAGLSPGCSPFWTAYGNRSYS